MSREYPERPLLGVGGVVIREGRALIVRRATEPLKGEWSIPGGLVELGEKLVDAVAREVLEETGLVVEPGEVLELFDSIWRDADGRCQYHYVLVDYLCRVTGGELEAATDVSDARWIRPQEIDDFGLRPATQGVLRKGFERFPNQPS
ncbi:NUDIX hydrolase [Candidatus Koribacter versatilis Ellin345]|uniref:NUDIX hydrolase n=1 Tax=Koribacter versatilis (strain Ellin345) TaxID=204669 RepID=Q1IRZ8_KORVE|nr:NUDIX hydrolase [Candidatus Koribacter versatilis]ABF40352.1 NUDIX hydrolase [Candidatus Koribacter versatilis Ellin345]